MTDIISTVGAIVTGSTTWLTSIVGTVSTTPLLLFFVLFGFVGIAIGLLMRFVNR